MGKNSQKKKCLYDPAPPPSRYHGDLTSPAPSGDHGISPSNKENTPPQDAPRKIPRKLRPRRRKERQPGSTTNQNSPSWKAGSRTQCAPTANRNLASQEIGSATRPGSTANHNSAFQEADSATQPRSTVNDNSPLAGNRPGISGSRKSTPVEHPRTFLRPQHPRFWTNQNSERRFDPDHPEFRGVYINRPSQASSRITPIDLVETPSPDLASPHLLFSDLIETPSLDRPLGI